MRRLQPKVYLIGETKVDIDSLFSYLTDIGVSSGSATKYTLEDGPENLVEFMGRLCYRSFEPGLNPNVTKIRNDSKEYINNILKSGHGSVLEHSQTNWVFSNISRVFTHELVRHRAGCAYSQESLRYVRLTDLGLWLPPDIEQDPKLVELFEKTFKNLEELQAYMSEYLNLDEEKNFTRKKVLTSSMRRLAPIGLATTIGASFNFRALRHIIEMRTSEHAESEIRLVFDQVAHICKDRWPMVFQDFQQNEKGEWLPTNRKV